MDTLHQVIQILKIVGIFYLWHS